MSTLDSWIAELGSGPATVLVVALLLGLRHATDPDHLAAVSTLLLGDRTDGARRARQLGIAWGLGHGASLFLFGLPLVLFRRYLPAWVQQAAEVAIAAIIVALAVRLLLRWKRGYFHAHPHAHDGVLHAHPHLHEHPKTNPHPAGHRHRHAEALGRSPLAAFGIGVIHGIGGSAAAGILIVSAAPTTVASVLALLVFALGTATSMMVLSSALGFLLVRSQATRRLEYLIPVLGLVSVCFGVLYGLQGFAPIPD